MDSIGISVIVHEVDPQYQAHYVAWMNKAIEAHRRFPGYLATDIIMPVGAHLNYTIILRFITREHASDWLHSDVRNQLLKESAPWLISQDRYRTDDAARFWFTPLQGPSTVKRWKQWILSWAVVIFASSVAATALALAFEALALEVSPWMFKVLSTGLISALMVYGLMPLSTRLARGWLLR